MTYELVGGEFERLAALVLAVHSKKVRLHRASDGHRLSLLIT